LAGLGVFLYARAISPYRPHLISPKGWFGWFDQSQYPKPGEFLYPLGYPMVGAVGRLIGFKGDPFVLFDALAFSVSLGCLAVVAARLRGAVFAVATVAAVALATPLIELTVPPWSTTVTMLAVAVALLVATSGRPLSVPGAAVLGLMVGMAVAARLVDGLFVGIIAAVPILRTGWHRPRVIVVSGAVAAVLVGLVLASQAAVFGNPLTTPYSQHLGVANTSSDQSAQAYNVGKIPRSFKEVFITGEPHRKVLEGDPIGRGFPWAVAAPVGLLVLLRRKHPLRGPLVAAAFASVLSSAFYLSFRATTGEGLKFFGAHYFKAWFPLWGLLAAYAIAAGAEWLAGAWQGGRSESSAGGVADTT
jgi:hypothetical protein